MPPYFNRYCSTFLLVGLFCFSPLFLIRLDSNMVMAQTSDARKAESDRLLKQGIEQYQGNQFETALPLLQQALTLYRDIGDLRGQFRALTFISNSYNKLHNFQKIIEFDRQRLKLVEPDGNSEEKATILLSLGLAHLRLDQYHQAVKYAEEGLTVARAIEAYEIEPLVLNILFISYELMEDYPQANKYGQQLLDLARFNKDREAEQKATSSLGSIYNAQNNYIKAIEYYQQALTLAQALQSPLLEAEGLEAIASIYETLGDDKVAIHYYQKSLEVVRSSRKTQTTERLISAIDCFPSQQIEAASLGSLGRIYLWYLVDYSQAVNQAEQILQLAKRYQNTCFRNLALMQLGDVYRLQGNPAKALDYYQQGLTNERQRKTPGTEATQRQTVGLHIGSLASAYTAQGNFPKAIEYHQQSLEVAQESLDRRIKASALTNFGYTLLLANNFSEAEKHLREGLSEMETVRLALNGSGSEKLSDAYKVSFFDTYTVGYELLQQALIAQGKPEAALEIAEQSRARAFVELLAKRVSVGNQSPAAAMQPLAQSSTLQQIKRVAQSQQTTLVIYSLTYDPKHLAFFGSRAPKAVRNLPAKFYIWVVKPTGEVFSKQVDRDPQLLPLEDLITTVRQSIGVQSRATLVARPSPETQRQDREYQTAQLQQLHKLLIDPIADLLPKNESDRVIFIPQGSLFLVPFPALQDANGKYLIEKHTILTAPSIQVLDQTHQLQQQRKSNPAAETLVVGNPIMPIVTPYPGEPALQLNSLPGAEAEAKAIAPLLNTQALTGTQGTKATIKQKMPNARIIHLATHGLLDDIRGLGSAITLAPDHPGTPNDGLLTAEEILDMKLSANLVVLSACDTGRGRITGDGVIGLSRSLITAGVPSIIVSLWAVPDAPTAELMSEFYTNWQQRKLDKAQSLRQAMLDTMKDHPNPRDWAAFTLIGEAE